MTAEELRRRRELIGLTQTDLARRAGMSRAQIIRLELGQSQIVPLRERQLREILDEAAEARRRELRRMLDELTGAHQVASSA